MPIDWRGVYAAATTEFHAHESLDPVATKRHFERLIDGGIHGLVVMGTVGDWYMPLLHLDTLSTLVQCIKLADAEVGFGSETVRAPRRPLVGEERERVLRIIRTAIATWPRSPAR